MNTSTVRTASTGYRALPRIAGVSYLVTSVLGRQPLAMVPLAILTLATSATGSLAIGGLAAAAAAIGEAVGAPLSGWLADRHGQRTVLLTAAALHVASMIVFGVVVGTAADTTAIALAAAAGFTLPQVGPLSRARWLAMAGADDLPAAFAFEGVADEVAFIVGPALVGLTATAFSPHAALLLSGALIAVFATAFAVHPTHRLVPRGRRASTAGRPALRAPGRAALIGFCFTGMLSMGLFFGASQTALTAFAGDIGIPDAGALLYAVMAVGSAAATMAMVRVPERIGPWQRWCLSAVGMTVGSVLMLNASDVVGIVLAALLAGTFQGPVLLTIFSVAGSLAESGGAGGLMTFVGSGIVLGVAAGTAIAGPVAQHTGAPGAFWVGVGASVLAVVVGLLGAATSRARRH
ncbi:MFS transporter [Microbacterium sp. No. 7]|uniref:MFS transporter n=1 Tax=Microbacterium sp. No. 7 TaxID=1714373 RepID=UPI0006D07742|nr:MFS transporter [Microbacterium sp. No. 7]ALJ21033.1 hypothetical protein AOA12_14445 [Microbacterium sp. No. 7]